MNILTDCLIPGYPVVCNELNLFVSKLGSYFRLIRLLSLVMEFVSGSKITQTMLLGTSFLTQCIQSSILSVLCVQRFASENCSSYFLDTH